MTNNRLSARGPEKYGYRLNTTYYGLGGAVLGNIVQDGVLTVPFWLKAVWVAVFLFFLSLFVSAVVVGHKRRQKKLQKKP